MASVPLCFVRGRGTGVAVSKMQSRGGRSGKSRTRGIANRISAPEAERLGLYPDWSTWPLGANIRGDWDWLFAQVQAGWLPDLPCHWSEHVGDDRTAIYWLDPDARTRHYVVGYGRFILTSPALAAPAMHCLH